jgi:hypothetical protein
MPAIRPAGLPHDADGVNPGVADDAHMPSRYI